MTTTHDIKKGDKVRILIGEGDKAYYSMAREMRPVRGEIGTVQDVWDNRISVAHPTFRCPYNYKPSEVEKVKGGIDSMINNPALSADIHRNAPIDATHYNVDCREKYLKKDEAGTIYHSSNKDDIWTAYPFKGMFGKDHFDGARPLKIKVTIRGKSADSVIVDDTAPEKHIQSHDELVAENESLEKQIIKLEARIERKKEFQRQNVRKIAAWQVILEK